MEKAEVKSLKLWNENMLHTFWNKDRNHINIDEEDLATFNMIIVHESQFNDSIKKQF